MIREREGRREEEKEDEEEAERGRGDYIKIFINNTHACGVTLQFHEL